MPLNTQVLRKGKPVHMSWDGLTLSCFLTTALKETDPEFEYQEGKTFGELPDGEWVNFGMSPIYYLATKSPLWHHGEITLTSDHHYEFVYDDGEKGEADFKAGDKFIMYRSHK